MVRELFPPSSEIPQPRTARRQKKGYYISTMRLQCMLRACEEKVDLRDWLLHEARDIDDWPPIKEKPYWIVNERSLYHSIECGLPRHRVS
jgi:hypothetical protein